MSLDNTSSSFRARVRLSVDLCLQLALQLQSMLIIGEKCSDPIIFAQWKNNIRHFGIAFLQINLHQRNFPLYSRLGVLASKAVIDAHNTKSDAVHTVSVLIKVPLQ